MVTTTQQQLRLLLDTRIPLEAMVLQRLNRIPKGRQNEWLRQLLLVGFRSECQAIKSEQLFPAFASPVRQSGMTKAIQANHRTGIDNRREAETIAAPPNYRYQAESIGREPQTMALKPFTHLSRVIGE